MDPSLAEHLAEEWDRRPLAVPENPGSPRPGTFPGRGDVLLVGRATDEHLDAVQQELDARGAQAVRIDCDRRLAACRPCERSHELWSYHGVLCREVDASGPVAYHADRCARTAAWDGASGRVRGFAVEQRRMALLGLLDTVLAPTWINDPWAMLRADVKARQLRVAAAQGLRVPRTLISDTPATIAAFAKDVGAVVFKSLGDAFVWEDGDRAGFLYTSELTPSALAELDERTPVPGIFQERLLPLAEYRVTVVGDRLFCARAPLAPEGLDWRRRLADAVPFEPAELDRDVADGVRRTVAALGLAFAAVDLLESAEGLWFLEVNPSGAYGWLERSLGHPISAAICDLLLADDR